MSLFSPLFIWTDALLKNGKSALDSMQEIAKRAKPGRVGVIPTADAPPRKATASKPKARTRARKAKGRRR